MEHRARRAIDEYTLGLAIIELWTTLLVLGITMIGLLGSGFFFSLAPLIWAAILLHWVVLARVYERRRWASVTSLLLGLIYLLPPSSWLSPQPWTMGVAWALAAVALSIVTGWQDLKEGW
jgi:hypothetical protein